MKHYYCTGPCKGLATEQQMEGIEKVCQMEGCSKHHEPLVECNCDNMEVHQQ